MERKEAQWHMERENRVRVFDPRTMGAVYTARILKVGRTRATVEFTLTGKVNVSLRDIIDAV